MLALDPDNGPEEESDGPVVLDDGAVDVKTNSASVIAAGAVPIAVLSPRSKHEQALVIWGRPKWLT